MRHLAANISSQVREIHDHFLWRKRAQVRKRKAYTKLSYILCPELKTEEWWISKCCFELLVLLNPINAYDIKDFTR